jgi:hypothetical protein
MLGGKLILVSSNDGHNANAISTDYQWNGTQRPKPFVSRLLFSGKSRILRQIAPNRPGLMLKCPAILTSVAIKKVTDAKGAIFVWTVQSCDLETVVIGIVKRQSSAMIRHYPFQRSAHALKNSFACRSGECKLIDLQQRFVQSRNISLWLHLINRNLQALERNPNTPSLIKAEGNDAKSVLIRRCPRAILRETHLNFRSKLNKPFA